MTNIYYFGSSQLWRRNDSEQIARTKSNITITTISEHNRTEENNIGQNRTQKFTSEHNRSKSNIIVQYHLNRILSNNIVQHQN